MLILRSGFAAPLVENSIDAKARHITVIRAREKGVSVLRIKDDGEGIRKNPGVIPDFNYVATHICNSIKREIKCQAEALITVTDSMLPQKESREAPTREGIPSYTFQKAPGELWRSRFNPDQNVVVINSGHRDFVYASRNKALQLRYISRPLLQRTRPAQLRGPPAGPGARTPH